MNWSRLAPAAGLLLLSGCGYVGDPLPPLANVPARVSNLSAVQRGSRILVQFKLPELTTEGTPVKTPLRPEVRIGTLPGEQWAANARPVNGGTVEKEVWHYELPSAEWTDQDVTIGVRTTGPNRKRSDWAYANLRIVPAPPKPVLLPLESTAEGIRLRWEGPEGAYRIYRLAGGEHVFSRVADVTGHEWLDRGAQFGTAYTYRVQGIVGQSESDPSEERSLTAKDIFAPAVPKGLRADAAPDSIELVWEPDTEADLEGYRVYRAVGSGNFEKLAEVPGVPSYSDRSIEHGKTYRYTISAYDHAGNESQRSAPVEAAVR